MLHNKQTKCFENGASVTENELGEIRWIGADRCLPDFKMLRWILTLPEPVLLNFSNL